MHRVILQRTDGGISVGQPVHGREGRFIEQMLRRPEIVGRVGEIDEASLPPRELRDAWTWDGGVRVPLRRAKQVALQAWWRQGRSVLRMLQARLDELIALNAAELLDDPGTITTLSDHIVQVQDRLMTLAARVKAATDEATLMAVRPSWGLTST